MPQHIDENGKLKVEVFRVTEDYQYLDRESKLDILTLISEWTELELIKLQFEE